MSVDRPDDIGEQFPGANPSVQDVTEGRTEADYGTRPDFIEAFPPTRLASSGLDLNPGRQFQVISIADEIIFANEVTLDEGVEVIGASIVFIAKPIDLRKSTYDGTVDSDGFTLASVTASRRSLIKNNLTLFEIIFPAYNVNDRIFAIESEGTGVTGITFLDLNNSSRVWINEEPRYKYFQIVDTDKDTHDCREWDFATNAQKIDSEGVLLPEVLVAKIHDLRGSTWAGNTIAGVAYTSTDGTGEGDGHETRQGVGTVTEQQLIIPEYLNNVTIIRASFVEIGTGAFRNSIQAIWEETSARAFSKAFA